MNNSNDRQSTTAFLSLSGPQLPVDLEFNPHHLPDIFRKHHLPLGRCFGSKSAYREANTKCEFVPNANVISKRDGKVWWGDLDLVRDSAVLEKIARLLRCRLYVLGEHDGRFDKAAPSFGINQGCSMAHRRSISRSRCPTILATFWAQPC